MSKPPLRKMWGLWKLGELLVERAVGYIIQHMLDHNDAILSLRADVDRLIAHTRLPLDKK